MAGRPKKIIVRHEKDPEPRPLRSPITSSSGEYFCPNCSSRMFIHGEFLTKNSYMMCVLCPLVIELPSYNIYHAAAYGFKLIAPTEPLTVEQEIIRALENNAPIPVSYNDERVPYDTLVLP